MPVPQSPGLFMMFCCCCGVFGGIGRAFRFGVVAVLGICCVEWRRQPIIVDSLLVEVICDGARARANVFSLLLFFSRSYTSIATSSSL